MSNTVEQAADILRRILAKADIGPRECVGADMRGGLTWKASFDALLGEAREVVGESGFGAA